VAAGEEDEQYLMDDVVLADEHALQLSVQAPHEVGAVREVEGRRRSRRERR
jgi:hypothetical protein